VDDDESIRAIHYALAAGINFFDTAANYGCGHSERTVPIPGFKTLAQVKENIQAMEFGLLNGEQMRKIDEIFERLPNPPS
jgi:aryl-alcohol dehydrogenase-like predicted oxidoreductase